MKSEIINVLEEIEKAENIEILYACEAGSRILGFANENSDYDVCFIYRNVNVSDYLSLKESDDVIEYSGEGIDIIGWDIRKALTLHYKSNPRLREWLISNQVYIDRGIEDVFEGLGDFDKNVLKNYYLSMAKGDWKRYCGLKYQKKKAKKYLYVIRCILCWNLLNHGIDPPLSILDLMNNPYSGICDEKKIEVIRLINHLKTSTSVSENTIFKLNNFILNSFRSMEKVRTDSIKDFDKYEERFKELHLIVR